VVVVRRCGMVTRHGAGGHRRARSEDPPCLVVPWVTVPMTDAERQARRYAPKEERIAKWRTALERIRTARTVREARAIAEEACGRQAARRLTPPAPP
jgi:hypothetical protein